MKNYLIIFLFTLILPVSIAAKGSISAILKVNNAGWRPGDKKIGISVKDPRGTVELCRSSDHKVVMTLTKKNINHFGIDDDSGDDVWELDFSSFTEPGIYYIYLPAYKVRSYDFEINEKVYDAIGLAAMKSYYYQRCNTPKEEKYAGIWNDASCHDTDFKCPPFKDAPDCGILDLHGGWHDAGDYQKTLWWIAVEPLLWAYELHPERWTDNHLNIPESGNGIPDILDEISWELDFFMRMQRPDGHFLSSVKGCDPKIASPPSKSDQIRGYFDTKSYGCSGGGATIEFATAHAVLVLSHAALIYRDLGKNSIAVKYEEAARKGWDWLMKQDFKDKKANNMKCCAASAIFRLDPEMKKAKEFVESYPGIRNPGPAAYDQINWAIWEYLANPQGDDKIKEVMKKTILTKVVNVIFAQESAYTGLRGGKGDSWDWHWGSSQNQGMYGANLLLAEHFEIRGNHSSKEMRDLGQKYLHFMLGRNALNMVFLTSMQDAGAEHSSFQAYHHWFSHTGGDGDNGNVDFNGKPENVNEPLYPYYKDDNQTSKYGPAPGLVVGGPNGQYGTMQGIWVPPAKEEYPARAYRDFSVGCKWNGSRCVAASWEITEPALGYQGSFMLLVSFFMSPANK